GGAAGRARVRAGGDDQPAGLLLGEDLPDLLGGLARGILRRRRQGKAKRHGKADPASELPDLHGISSREPGAAPLSPAGYTSTPRRTTASSWPAGRVSRTPSRRSAPCLAPSGGDLIRPVPQSARARVPASCA